MNHKLHIILLCAVCMAGLPTMAQSMKQTFIVKDGKLVPDTPSSGSASGKASSQKATTAGGADTEMVEAAQAFMKRDFTTAEQAYSRAIALDANHTAAYLQRGLVRREMKQTQGMAADAKKAYSLADAALKQNPKHAEAYYQRSVALRLLGKYDAARADLRNALALENRNSWKSDLRAIDLEQKMAR